MATPWYTSPVDPNPHDPALDRMLKEELMLPGQDLAEVYAVGLKSVDDLRIFVQYGKHRGLRISPLTEAKLDDWYSRLSGVYSSQNFPYRGDLYPLRTSSPTRRNPTPRREWATATMPSTTAQPASPKRSPYYDPNVALGHRAPSPQRGVQTPRYAQPTSLVDPVYSNNQAMDVNGYCRWFVTRGGHVRFYNVVPPTATCFECREKIGRSGAIALDRMLHHRDCAVQHIQRLLLQCKIGFKY
eukprot:PhF_6_TR3489/c0_g1_i1/m.5123